jgi:hypothetical protein
MTDRAVVPILSITLLAARVGGSFNSVEDSLAPVTGAGQLSNALAVQKSGAKEQRRSPAIARPPIRMAEWGHIQPLTAGLWNGC